MCGLCVLGGGCVVWGSVLSVVCGVVCVGLLRVVRCVLFVVCCAFDFVCGVMCVVFATRYVRFVVNCVAV